jgi:hypothetical protein
METLERNQQNHSSWKPKPYHVVFLAALLVFLSLVLFIDRCQDHLTWVPFHLSLNRKRLLPKPIAVATILGIVNVDIGFIRCHSHESAIMGKGNIADYALSLMVAH